MRATSVERRRGGNCGNLLEVIAQFENTRPWLIAPLVNDEYLSFLRQDLEERCGINTSHCIIHSEGQTPSAYIIISKDSNKRSIISNSDTVESLSVPYFGKCYKKLMSQITADDAFHWFHFEGRWPMTTIDMLTYANRRGSFVSIELENPKRKDCEVLQAEADVVFYSKAYAVHHGATSARQFLEARAKLIFPGNIENSRTLYLFCTWGDEPAAVYDRGGNVCYTQSPNKVKALDTNGAGDCFCAAAIHAMSKYQRDGEKIEAESVLKFAVNLASRKCARTGFSDLLVQK